MSGRRVTVVASEVLGVPGTGGPGTADSLLAVALGRHGHRVELLVAPGRAVGELTGRWERTYTAAGVRVRPLEVRRRVRPQFLAPDVAVLDALRADPPDVVVADDWRGLAWAALRLRQLGGGFADTAFVVYCHGPARVLAEAARKVPDTLARFGEEVAERACLELADAVVSPSGWLLDWMRSHRWPVPDSAQVVQNLWQSVALGEPAAHAAATAPLRRLAFFGQLREGKGIRLYTSALQRLEPRLLEGVELLFLGRESSRWPSEQVREALGPTVREAAASIRFETSLERSAALQLLLEPGTLAVLPSLLENSPYAVAECVEHGIPFVATDVGGVSELVDERDHDRVLVQPNVDALAEALALVAAASEPPSSAAPARSPETALETWLRLIEDVAPPKPEAGGTAQRVAVVVRDDRSAARARRLAAHARAADVVVVQAESRRAGLERSEADWVMFLDDDDDPQDDLLDVLLAAQAASGADAVTVAVRPTADLGSAQLFLGDPGALGLVENQYGVLGLVRRSLAERARVLDGVTDPDWPLFAEAAIAGGVVVSHPDPASTHARRPGSVVDVPGEGLAVLEAFERGGAGALHDLPQLSATLAAAFARLQARPGLEDGLPGPLRRGVGVLRSEGIVGVARRVRGRLDEARRKSP
jgi:glycosyltransferase involved in cell wall biosynthesis